MTHLTDDQIQSYLDGDNQLDRSDIENHLNNCIDCQFSLNKYRELYKAVQMQPIPTLSGDFAKKIITGLHDSTEKKWKIFENAIVVFLMITGIFSVIYFSFILDIAGYFRTMDITPFINIGNIFDSNFIGKYSYIFFSAIVIVVIELIDLFFIKKPRQQPSH